MGFSTIFKYLGLAMEAANQAAEATALIKVAKGPDSDGGEEITKKELATIASQLDDNFSEVLTRICQETGIPVKSVSVTVEI